MEITNIRHQEIVSLTFHEPSKMIPQNLDTSEIEILLTSSSWNFVRVPKVMRWAHVQSFIVQMAA